MTTAIKMAFIFIALLAVSCRSSSRSHGLSNGLEENKSYVECKSDKFTAVGRLVADSFEFKVSQVEHNDITTKAKLYREELAAPQQTVTFLFEKDLGALVIECEGVGKGEGGILRLQPADGVLVSCDFAKAPCGAEI